MGHEKAKRGRGRPKSSSPPVIPKKTLQKTGRPSAKVPDEWKPAVYQMAAQGKTLEEIRQLLLTANIEATRESIGAAMHGDKTRMDEIVAAHGDPTLRGLQSPLFDDFAPIVDDFIHEGRSPQRIAAYLKIEGFVVTNQELEDYVMQRAQALQNEAKPATLPGETRKSYMHLRVLERRIVEIWHNMPPEKKYTDRMFMVHLTEYGNTMHRQIERLRGELEGNDRDTESVNAELERKLGLALDGEGQGVEVKEGEGGKGA